MSRFAAAIASAFRRYAAWLVAISWKRFILLSILLLIVAGILSNIPPFTWDLATRTTRVPASRNVDIKIDENGVRITPRRDSAKGPEIVIDEATPTDWDETSLRQQNAAAFHNSQLF